MIFGIDYSQGMPSITSMKNASVRFCCRYTGFTAPSLSQLKILTPQEALVLSNAGISIISNFEWYNLRTTEGFGAGVLDAITAERVHHGCGGPDTSPIYFSVDYNSNGLDVEMYFRGIVSVLGIARVGVYGGIACVSHLLDKGLVTYVWQTYAWSNNNWDQRAHIRQYDNSQRLGIVPVDEDEAMVDNYGQWIAKPWYTYPIVVPFGNINYDKLLGGSHDLDVSAPPNYPVTALLPGVVSSITSPDWGRAMGIKLDIPYNSVPYCAYLHLSAVNPALHIGTHVNKGDVIGWVGGANSQVQYDGTTNPTGENFVNSTNSSSQIQVGFALMRGPEYGVGSGWETFPPIDQTLDPTNIILVNRASGGINPVFSNALCIAIWESYFLSIGAAIPARDTGIFNSWRGLWISGHFKGACIGAEFPVTLPNGDNGVAQNFGGGTCVWDLTTSTPTWL